MEDNLLLLIAYMHAKRATRSLLSADEDEGSPPVKSDDDNSNAPPSDKANVGAGRDDHSATQDHDPEKINYRALELGIPQEDSGSPKTPDHLKILSESRDDQPLSHAPEMMSTPAPDNPEAKNIRQPDMNDPKESDDFYSFVRTGRTGESYRANSHPIKDWAKEKIKDEAKDHGADGVADALGAAFRVAGQEGLKHSVNAAFGLIGFVLYVLEEPPNVYEDNVGTQWGAYQNYRGQQANFDRVYDRPLSRIPDMKPFDANKTPVYDQPD